MKLTTAFQLCNSMLITFCICLSLPDGTRHLMISCLRETINHISAAAALTAHLERTKYSLTCLQRRHPRCRESPSSGGMPAPGSRSPNARLGSSKQSLTWRRRALPGSWTQHRSLSGKHQAESKTGCLKTYTRAYFGFWLTYYLFLFYFFLEKCSLIVMLTVKTKKGKDFLHLSSESLEQIIVMKKQEFLYFFCFGFALKKILVE